MEEKKIISNVFKNKSNVNKKNNEIKPEEQYAIELQNINSMYLDDNLKINEPYKTLHKLISQKINSDNK